MFFRTSVRTTKGRLGQLWRPTGPRARTTRARFQLDQLEERIVLSPALAMDLGGSFNRTGIVSDGSTFPSNGGFDGTGTAISSQLLGTSLTWNGTPFTIGPTGSNDVVSATGQTISLPAGKYASLQFLAGAVWGNQVNQRFIVTYADGTTATFTQSISDWATPQYYAGESTALTMGYRDNSNGTQDSSSPLYIYGYSFRLDATKTVSSITLPNDANVELLSATLSPAADTTPPPSAVTQPTLLRLEVVTNNALVDNYYADNQWGGNKLRIIRMSNGDLYTAYNTATAAGPFHNQWNLAKRNSNGTWSVVATGMAGQEPVNLLRGPQDQIYLVSWDGGLPSLTTSTDGVHFSTQAIPGAWPRSDWPYSSAGISPAGDLYVLQSDGTEKPGKLYVGSRTAADGQWHFTTINTDYRYCYNYLFPTSNGPLQILGERDVQWATLGWTQPPGAFAYTFDGLRQFRTSDVTSQPFANTLVAQDVQSPAHEEVETQLRDVYVDPNGTMHITYLQMGADTSGSYVAHVATVDSSGTVLKDVAIPGGADQPRLYQSPTDGRFYVISNQGQVYPAGADGTQLGSPVTLNLQGYHMYGPNGVFLAAPRGGTPLSNIVDGVFATSSGGWVYIRIQLP